MKLKELVEWLVANSLATKTPGGYYIRDHTVKHHIGELNLPEDGLLPDTPKVFEKNYMTAYRGFIIDAEIPTRGLLSNGGEYVISTVSAKAANYLKTIIIDKVCTYDEITSASKLFYSKSKGGMPKLTNFFLEGYWETALSEYRNKKSGKSANTGLSDLDRLR